MSAAPDAASRLRRAIFARCRAAGIDDGARRDLQRRATGKASLTQMSLSEMGAVLEALGGEAPARASLPENSHTSKLRALWISAWCLGVVRNRSDDALAAFIRRQAGIDAARWATPAQTAAAIEALKDWMERDGGVDWSPYARDGARPKEYPRARVLEALWRKLHRAGAVRVADPGALHHWVVARTGDQRCYVDLGAREQDGLIREFGEWLRRVSRGNG